MKHIQYVVNVEGAIIHDGKYLLIVRGKNESHAGGLLAFVGGTVDSVIAMADVLEQNLRREIFEEIGLNVGEMIFTQAHQFILGDAFVINIIFLCQYIEGEAYIASHDEVDDMMWLGVDEIINHPLAPPWLIDNVRQVEEMRLKFDW